MPALAELLFHTPWLKLLKRNGHIFVSRREANAPVKTDAVVIIAWHSDDQGATRLVVIDEFRAALDAWHLGLPAGLIDDGETPEQAAVRELREETGLEVVEVTGASVGTLYSSAGLADEVIKYVSVTCRGAPARQPGVGSEQIRVHLLTQEDARAMLRDAEISGRAMSARLWLVLNNFAATGAYGGSSRDAS